jgi:hypothetical protein
MLTRYSLLEIISLFQWLDHNPDPDGCRSHDYHPGASEDRNTTVWVLRGIEARQPADYERAWQAHYDLPF